MKKICNTCGVGHIGIPESARKWVDEGKFLGWFWECKCGSTMFAKAVGKCD